MLLECQADSHLQALDVMSKFGWGDSFISLNQVRGTAWCRIVLQPSCTAASVTTNTHTELHILYSMARSTCCPLHTFLQLL